MLLITVPPMLWIPHQLGKYYNYYLMQLLRRIKVRLTFIFSWCSRRIQRDFGVFLRSSSNVIELLDEGRWPNDTRFEEISVSAKFLLFLAFMVPSKSTIFGNFINTSASHRATHSPIRHNESPSVFCIFIASASTFDAVLCNSIQI